MKVRHKSEIAKAVEGNDGVWLVSDPICGSGRLTSEALAAHYEPVPEPPAACIVCGKSADEHAKYIQTHGFTTDRRKSERRSAPSVSDEQPAVLNRPEKDYPQSNKIPDKIATHRATIALIPCKCYPICEIHYIEIDGVKLCQEDDSSLFWTGTEAAAKAKLESLRGENNGD